jgi:hypothetical protein
MFLRDTSTGQFNGHLAYVLQLQIRTRYGQDAYVVRPRGLPFKWCLVNLIDNNHTDKIPFSHPYYPTSYPSKLTSFYRPLQP